MLRAKLRRTNVGEGSVALRGTFRTGERGMGEGVGGEENGRLQLLMGVSETIMVLTMKPSMLLSRLETR